MNKVGIITHYYNSSNYGGNLQAYALCIALKKIGFEAEQISYPVVDHVHVKPKQLRKGLKKVKHIAKTIIAKTSEWKDVIYILKNRNKYSEFLEKQKEQTKAFYYFNQVVIPHSAKVYDEKSFPDATNEYDAFITGSDQVWNFSWFQPAYFLEGIPSNKKKIAYAASIGSNNLDSDQQEYCSRTLKDFQSISVREKSTAIALSKILDREVVTVVDPTLLLSRNDWDNVCSARIITEPYIFAYFLGNNEIARKTTIDYSKHIGLQIVNIPMNKDKTHYFDENFGDITLFDVSPSDFLSLIKYAEYVFTDSFHATVFSYIYRKEVFIFNRDSGGRLKDRIENITDLFNLKERFCEDSSKLQFDYIKGVNPIDYSDSTKVDSLIDKSYEYLKNALTMKSM